jgi:hypothetical protein
MRKWKITARVNNTVQEFIVDRFYMDGEPFEEKDAMVFVLQHMKTNRPSILITNIEEITNG